MASYDTTKMKKPGYMGRAIFVWAILNIILFGTLAGVSYFLQIGAEFILHSWIIVVILAAIVVASEWGIMWATIGPIMLEWIKQEETVKEGEKPSWDKSPSTPKATVNL